MYNTSTVRMILSESCDCAVTHMIHNEQRVKIIGLVVTSNSVRGTGRKGKPMNKSRVIESDADAQ
jgi:hypothetical protein